MGIPLEYEDWEAMMMGQHDIIEIMNCERSMQPYCWEKWMDAELLFVALARRDSGGSQFEIARYIES